MHALKMCLPNLEILGERFGHPTQLSSSYKLSQAQFHAYLANQFENLFRGLENPIWSVFVQLEETFCTSN